MDWVAPLSTIIGATVGLGSAVIVDRFRWRRDVGVRWNQTRRGVYVEFLTAVSNAHFKMRATTFRTDVPEAERYGALCEALDGSGIWRQRQEISLTAPHHVLQRAVATADELQNVRDVLIAEFDTNSDQYLRARADLWVSNAELREAMRRDLGVAGQPDPELGQYRYVPQAPPPDPPPTQELPQL